MTGILAVIIGAAVLVYFTWAAHRLDALTEPGWPRPWPYPDGWLLALNNYYDAKYPAPPRAFKLHGELLRVRRDVTWASRAGGVVCGSGLAMLVLPSVLRRTRSRHRGFEVLTESGGRQQDIGPLTAPRHADRQGRPRAT